MFIRASRCLSLALCAGATTALAQTAPLPSLRVPAGLDSGDVAPPAQGRQVVFAGEVAVPGAAWLRLDLADVVLGGVEEEASGAYLRLTSLADGGVQLLNARHVREWANSTAYFNGDRVRVEIIASPASGPTRVRVSGATAGLPTGVGVDDICGATDDRTLISDNRVARHLPEGCTSWLHDDTNGMFLTAAHCGVGSGDVQQFNVPLSTSTGATVNPPPQDQYAVEAASVQASSAVLGNDWAYFAVTANSNTGLVPYQAYGARYVKGTVAAASGQTIRITGFGVTTGSQGTPLTWSQVNKTHTGPETSLSGTIVRYTVDTTGGNSGSPIHDLAQDKAVGIHTNAGCASGGNQGTTLQQAATQTALNNPLSLCKTGRGTVTPPLYALGDGANNLGTLNTSTGNFARVAFGPVRSQGLTYDWNAQIFYAIDLNPFTGVQVLYFINPATGAGGTLANVVGAGGAVNGLGYDPNAGVLYGVIQASGQLVRINTTTGAATLIGTGNAGTTIGGLEFDPRSNTLYGVNDAAGGTTLVTFNTTTGAITTIGVLGAGATDCNGLAVTDDGQLWTINAPTQQLLRINPATGAATLVGPTGGIFGSGFGMAATLTKPAAACYANCDGSTDVPSLTAADFSCFLSKFRAGDSYANCDGSTGAPTLTAADFACFLSKFRAGCP